MIRGAEPGDRVQVLNGDGSPCTWGHRGHGVDNATGYWDFAQDNTGTVTRTFQRSPNRPRFVYVTPNPPFHGEFAFRPRDLRRLPQPHPRSEVP